MKKKPIIKKVNLDAYFENSFGNEEVIQIDVHLLLKLENVPVLGEAKYQIVKDIEEALEPVKEKYALKQRL